MSEYDNTNSGVLFKNDKKGNDKAPDYSGKINVNGKEMRLAAWIRDGQKGKFMSLKLSEQEGQQAPKPAAKPAATSSVAAAGGGEFDDDIQF